MEMVVQVAVAGLDCNRSEVVQECLERLVGEHSLITSVILREAGWSAFSHSLRIDKVFTFCCSDPS